MKISCLAAFDKTSGAAIWNKSPRLFLRQGRRAAPVWILTPLMVLGVGVQSVVLASTSAAGPGP